MNTVYALGSVLLVSLISLAGLLTLSLSVERLRKYLFVLVSFAVGSLFGDAFLHLLPEAFETAGSMETVSIWVLVGIGLFFVLEKRRACTSGWLP
ncbi:MAG: Zinc/iron permease [Parcubacteria group bacterium GW2011_GWF2_52_12]|nr:MAG: Zinc/iron permease [Parcubacteria group bacterium GW2011_GWF2_52_12]